jgi:diguanylate cyclase (GGDEF)-like protein
MLLDLDHFKSINDRFGHATGDRVLEIFADVSSGCLRRIDLFGRLGGEEFGAVLRDTGRERALAVGEQIRTSFAEAAREIDGRLVGATVSVGIVISQDAVLDLSALLAQADHALYRAKDAGRNRVEIASIELILDRARRGAADVLAAVGGKPAGAKPAAQSAA